jgi:hypothetical protein
LVDDYQAAELVAFILLLCRYFLKWRFSADCILLFVALLITFTDQVTNLFKTVSRHRADNPE